VAAMTLMKVGGNTDEGNTTYTVVQACPLTPLARDERENTAFPPTSNEVTSPVCGDCAIWRWSKIVAGDMRWASEETHVMICDWLCPAAFAHLPAEERVTSCRIRWNPLYWLCWLMGWGCILTGKWFHSIVGQGGAVRPDETKCEHDARVHWVYGCDGPMVGEMVYEAVGIVYYISQSRDDELLGPALAIVIAGCFLIGNVAFLHAMAIRSITEVRVCIVCSCSFGLGLFAALIGALVHGPRGMPMHRASRNHQHPMRHPSEEASMQEHVPGPSWVLRACVVMGILLSAWVYRPLWSLYTNEECMSPASRNRRGSLWYRCARLLAVGSGFALVWILVLVAFAIGGDSVWDALS